MVVLVVKVQRESLIFDGRMILERDSDTALPAIILPILHSLTIAICVDVVDVREIEV
jgi:hypothetical protein